MALGLGRGTLAPDAFWAMTPRELEAVSGAAAGAMARPAAPSPLARRDLLSLMETYPDR